MTKNLLDDLSRLDYKAAAKWILSFQYNDLYDFLADTGADPWGKPGADTRDGLLDYAFAHIDNVGPFVLLDWIDQTGGDL